MSNEALAKDVQAEAAGLPLPTDRLINADLVLKKTEAMIKAMDGLIKLSILRTNPSDWAKFGDGFWLCDSGAMKIRNIWGIYFRDTEIVEDRNEDGSVTFIATARCGCTRLDDWYGQEVVIDAYGSRSTADGFFGSNPDREDVKKAALANMRARAICDVLGLKNLTEADLKSHGIDTSKIAMVEFKKGSKGGAVASEDDKTLQVKLYNALVKLLGSSDEKILSQALVNLTKFKGRDGKEVPGVSSIKALTGKRLQIAYAKATDALEKEHGPGQDIQMDREPGAEG